MVSLQKVQGRVHWGALLISVFAAYTNLSQNSQNPSNKSDLQW